MDIVEKYKIIKSLKRYSSIQLIWLFVPATTALMKVILRLRMYS